MRLAAPLRPFTLLMSALLLAAPTPPSARAMRLLHEGQRELKALRQGSYDHRVAVDEAAGRFDYDCSGFLHYALGRVDPEAQQLLPITSKSKKRPLAQDFHAFFKSLGEAGQGPWKRVLHARNLKPGDIVAWLKAPDSDSHNTGHVMLVREHAYPNPDRRDEILVPIIDSTMSAHAQDSRAKGETGLGQGLIGILVDGEGRPLAYRWKGGESKRAVETDIAFGRLE
ncbi:hypothetical protein [Geothrix sp. PMB-07]|uniref:hypothetical protein n=1 Tax=Geothrix sp. PMB-07 TaxID=3068640 RepID=UPI002741DAA5|nr:hypothetical protein [Geothrix sp. PMB-07]WLT31105.1 hypothetical protein Q9293_15410 [Geothrix sp. PMB-07]